MKIVLAALSLFALGLICIVLDKALFRLPLHELKRRAATEEPLAAKLYQAAAYGTTARALLSLMSLASFSAGLVLIVRYLPPWAGFAVVLAALTTAFIWLPKSRVSSAANKLASLLSPAVRWTSGLVYPAANRVGSRMRRHFRQPGHTGLFERSDLLDLVNRQRQLHDNRISPEELEIVRRALTFGDHYVHDVLVPRSAVKTVLADATVGPILIDEVHKTGQEYVLVQDKKDGNVIGTLEVARLGLHSEGKIRDHMDPKVYYVHEDATLSQALHAFFVTNRPMFIAINSFEEFVGIVTVESILRQLLGHLPGEDFEEYANPAAVARRGGR